MTVFRVVDDPASVHAQAAASVPPDVEAGPERIPRRVNAVDSGRDTTRAREAAVDAALVRRTRDGDGDAFGHLVRRHLGAAHGVALSVLGDTGDAEDVCQDAFVAALERLDQCRPAEKFRAWLLTSVRNRAIDVLRHRRARPVEPLDSPDEGTLRAERAHPALASRHTGPVEAAERVDLRAHLDAALATLSDVRREVVLLHDLEGWTSREIAAHLGLADGTVRAHLFWARRALRARLSAELRSEGYHDE